MLRRQNHSHLQCSLWSQCWGISCWCTWWPSPCPFLSAGEDASLGRHMSATEDTTTGFTERCIISGQRCFYYWLLQQPSSWPWVNHQNRWSPMWNIKAQCVYNLNWAIVIFSPEAIHSFLCTRTNFVQQLYSYFWRWESFLSLWCSVGRLESWYPRSHSRRK